LLHQALITLGDGEPALLLAVAGMVVVGEEARPRREELRLSRDSTSGKFMASGKL
jgi:hypothetical protein